MSLNVLFLDMNSFFASVEQHERPETRGKPTAVAAVLTDSTCCIAASYEAKALGIRTGTPVWQAKLLCPHLLLFEGRPEFYVKVHHDIVRIVESHLHVTRIDSIDELWCRLMGRERAPARAVELAKKIKRSIYRDLGPSLRCSIGIAPNRVLAKVAADMQKPDGLTVIADQDLPHKLFPLELQDLPGVGPRMLQRLYAHHITTVEQMCAASEAQLRRVWSGVVGSWWWHWLRGYDLRERPTRKQTVGHSHVLPPGLRTDAGSHAVLLRLIQKAAARLRMSGYWAGRMEVYLSYSHDKEEGWSGEVELGLCQDTQTMIEAFGQLWPHRPREQGMPKQVAVTLFNLVRDGSAALPLFPEAQRRHELSHVIDRINGKIGQHAVYFGGMHDTRDAAPTRIAFSRVPEFQPQFD